MPESRPISASPPAISIRRRLFFYVFVIIPIASSILLYQIEPLEPNSLPNHELTIPAMAAPRRKPRMLEGSEQIGAAKLPGPEDIVYDPKTNVIYTGCADGWIKKITLNDTVVSDWVKSGGRPLGLAFGRHGNLIVADADNGLLNVTEDGDVEVLTNDADDVPFKLTDGVDVAKDGVIYFTDASFKYHLKDYIWDILEGKPHGRLISYDPTTKKTRVLVHDLYFANGVTVSPDQTHVVYCETVMRRCRKYHIKGEKKGTIEEFTNHLPGLPDNIHYDGDGHYWIALAMETTYPWELILKYAWLRKIVAIIERYNWRPHLEKNGGVFIVDLEGKPIAHYYDVKLSLISSGVKIGDHMYCGSIFYPYIIRLNITQFPAV